MLPTASSSNSISGNKALKPSEEPYLGLRNEIVFDRKKGLIFVNPRLYTQEKKYQPPENFLGKFRQTIDGLFNRFHEWRAKEWFVGFVEQNFKQDNKTKDLLESVKNSGRVSSSNLLEVLVDKSYSTLPSASNDCMDGSLRTRYFIQDKKNITDKLIIADLKEKGFSDAAVGAFVDFFNFSDQSWTRQSFQHVLSFLNEYDDRSQLSSSVFRISALQGKVLEMQIKATEFEAEEGRITQRNLRKNQSIASDGADTRKLSREDLCNFLKEHWKSVDVGNDNGNNGTLAPADNLKLAFLRYLHQGTKNPDDEFLENLRSFPNAVNVMPHVFGFPQHGENKHSGLKNLFDQVIGELKELKNRKRPVNDPVMDEMKIVMQKVVFNFRFNKEILKIFLFDGMTQYINSGDGGIINSGNRESFVAVSEANVDTVAQFAKLSENEKSSLLEFIKKLKNDLSYR
jgi:hypothetical protein